MPFYITVDLSNRLAIIYWLLLSASIELRSQFLITSRQAFRTTADREFTHFLWRKYGYVILVNVARLLLDLLRIALPLELLASKPEGDVLLAVLAHEELSEELAAGGALHQFVEGRAPDPDLLQAAAFQARVEAVESVETVTRTRTREVGDADAAGVLAAAAGNALFFALIARTGTRRITADRRQTETTVHVRTILQGSHYR